MLLFVVSGVAFSSFASLLLLAPWSFLAPLLLVAIPGIAGDDAGNFLAAFPAVWVFAATPLIIAGLGAGLLAAGNVTRAIARRLTIASIREAQQEDERPPILFLRPFYDDRVGLNAPRLSLLGRLVNLKQGQGSLDVLLVEECTTLGPVVALGNPQDPVPRYGAARGYFSDGNWQKGVADLARDSFRIIICLDTTEGVLWELDHIIRQGYLSKTLFLMHPGAKEQAKNRALRQAIINRLQPLAGETLDFGEAGGSDEGLLGFFVRDTGRMEAGKSREFSEASYLLMTRWFLRAT